MMKEGGPREVVFFVSPRVVRSISLSRKDPQFPSGKERQVRNLICLREIKGVRNNLVCHVFGAGLRRSRYTTALMTDVTGEQGASAAVNDSCYCLGVFPASSIYHLLKLRRLDGGNGNADERDDWVW